MAWLTARCWDYGDASFNDLFCHPLAVLGFRPGLSGLGLRPASAARRSTYARAILSRWRLRLGLRLIKDVSKTKGKHHE